ncbi:MAG: hypothetical protein FWF57_04490 [Defluviitaleaceae bacterium]|nr:hypothetical protein [Defluviitaleaceae bacterium]
MFTKKVKLISKSFLTLASVLIFTACGSREQNPELVGIWGSSDDLSWQWTFNADGTGSGGPGIGTEDFSWFTRGDVLTQDPTAAGIMNFVSNFNITDDTLVLDFTSGFSGNPTFTYYRILNDSKFFGEWVGIFLDFGVATSMNLNADGTHNSGSANHELDGTWFNTANMIVLDAGTVNEERWNFTYENGKLNLSSAQVQGLSLDMYRSNLNEELFGIWNWSDDGDWMYSFHNDGSVSRGFRSSGLENLQWITAGNYLIFEPFTEREEIWTYEIVNDTFTITSAQIEGMQFSYIR